MRRYGHGHMLRGRREQFFAAVVFDFGPEGRHCNAIASFRGRHASDLARELADEMNGESYVPPVLRSSGSSFPTSQEEGDQ